MISIPYRIKGSQIPLCTEPECIFSYTDVRVVHKLGGNPLREINIISHTWRNFLLKKPPKKLHIYLDVFTADKIKH